MSFEGCVAEIVNLCGKIYIDTTTLFDYEVVLLLIVSLHIYISYIFKYMLQFF